MNFQNQIKQNNIILYNLSKYLLSMENSIINSKSEASVNGQFTRQHKFTLEELAKYNGSAGTPAYAAVNGIVYDMSLIPAWGGGTHFGLYAGKDLSAEFNQCHKLQNILVSLPKVGVL